MKRIIEVEEVIRARHQIFVEYDSEEQLVNALEDENVKICDIDDFVDNLTNYGIEVNEINENCLEEVESIEYYDDYEED